MFKAVDCQSLHEEFDVSKMYWQQMDGFLCANMTDQSVLLQNESPVNSNGSSADFFFIVETCANVAAFTGRTDCKTEAESQAVIDSMYVQTKIQTQFWNVKNFVRNAQTMNSQWTTN